MPDRFNPHNGLSLVYVVEDSEAVDPQFPLVQPVWPQNFVIVTNLETDSRAVVRFYNKGGTAEQWIKEGKQAVKMTQTELPSAPLQRGPTVAEPDGVQPREPVASLGAAEED